MKTDRTKKNTAPSKPLGMPAVEVARAGVPLSLGFSPDGTKGVWRL